MKPIKTQEKMYHCVTDEQFLEFMSENGFEDEYEFALEHEILPEESYINWEKEYVFSKDEDDEEFTQECLYWIKSFFEAHPWVHNLKIINTDYFKN